MSEKVVNLYSHQAPAEDQTNKVASNLRILADKFESGEETLSMGNGVIVVWQSHNTKINTCTCGDSSMMQIIANLGHAKHLYLKDFYDRG